MDLSVFKPYKAIENSPKSITIYETKSRKIFLFVFFRVFPILIIAGVLLMVKLFYFPLNVQIFLLVIPILFIPFLFKKYIVKTEISDRSIKITLKSLFGPEIKECSINEIDKIIIEKYYQSRGGGYLYFIILNEKSTKIPLITIPFLYMNENRKNKISETLKSLTGKDILII